MLTLEQQKQLHAEPNPVLVDFEKSLSPRCQDSIAWDDNHVGGFVKPTKAHIPTGDEHHKNITDDDKAELFLFDLEARKRYILGTGLCTTMN